MNRYIHKLEELERHDRIVAAQFRLGQNVKDAFCLSDTAEQARILSQVGDDEAMQHELLDHLAYFSSERFEALERLLSSR